MNPNTAPFHLIVAYPDPASADYLLHVVQSGGFTPSITICDNLDTLYTVAADSPQNTLLLTDLVWNDSNAIEVILSLSIANPRLAPIIISAYDISSLLPAYSPFPVIHGFEDADLILKQVTACAEDLRGQSFGPYQIQEIQGIACMARTYSAYQPAIKRDVFLNIQPSNASESEKDAFRHLVRAQAGNIHPNIYSIYEESETQGRLYLSQEPITSPTLFALALQGFTFDARLLARVLNTISTTLQHMRIQSIPHQPISSAHITLSSEGVIKMLNTALPRTSPMPAESTEVINIAAFLSSFIPKDEPFNPELASLLAAMEAGSVSLAEVVSQSQAIDLALAPEKFVPQRKEAIVAQREITKARKTSMLGLIGGTVILTISTIFILYKILFGVVLEIPATNFQGQAFIPAGTLQVGGKEIEVKAFYIDEYETTIGQYEKFLADLEGRDPKPYLPPDWTGVKNNFRPQDWDGIMKSVRTNTFYPLVGEKLTRDHPIFNIDYADAYAYARWAGKRLPTEAEWQRAASGNEGFPFPWGKETERAFTNTGLDINNDEVRKIKAAEIDGFRGPAQVNVFRNKIRDVSPFGVKYMAGNVSEWVQASSELESTKDGQRIVRGGNFNTPRLMPNHYRVPQPQTTTATYIGLRCVSDQLIGKQIN